MAKIRVTVCDMCGKLGLETKRYRIARDDRTPVSLDLCRDDAAPLEAYIAKAGGPPAAAEKAEHRSTAKRGRRSVTPVLTMNEIEQLKEQRRSHDE